MKTTASPTSSPTWPRPTAACLRSDAAARLKGVHEQLLVALLILGLVIPVSDNIDTGVGCFGCEEC